MSELIADRMTADSSGAVGSDSPQRTGHGAAKTLFQGVWGVKCPGMPLFLGTGVWGLAPKKENKIDWLFLSLRSPQALW